MISIYKDKDMKVVTKGAYEQFYKPLGYNIIVENKEVKSVEKKLDKSKELDETVTEPKKKSSNNKKNKKDD